MKISTIIFLIISTAIFGATTSVFTFDLVEHISTPPEKVVFPPPEKIFPRVLESVAHTDVALPKSSKLNQNEEAILVIYGIELAKNTYLQFDVFITDEDDPISRPNNTVKAGSFVNLCRRDGKRVKRTSLNLDISKTLKDMDLVGNHGIIVNVVPRFGGDKIKIGGIKILLVTDGKEQHCML